MLEIVNYSPLAHLAFGAVDVDDDMHEVVVAKGAYLLAPAAGSDDVTLEMTLSSDLSTVLVSDEYFGAMNKSSVRVESDLAPFKPKCDVIVIASAHSPTGRPVARASVGIDIDAGATRLLGRHLTVHGERDLLRRDAFERGAAGLVWLATAGSVVAPEWYFGEPEPFLSHPLRYETAFGGELRIAADDPAAERVESADRLAAVIREKHPDGALAPIAHRVCRENPVGRGFIETWHAKATRATRYPAPRIEAVDAPVTAEALHALLRGQTSADPALTPQGFGVVTKSWQPRLKLAGTYDEAWRTGRWPNLPKDFDMAYWNGAHPAMQCQHLQGGEVVTLFNLLPNGAAGTRSERNATVSRLKLPTDRIALRLKLDDGRLVFVMMPIDTLTIDLEAMTVSLAWRVRVPSGMSLHEAALFKLPPRTEIPSPATDAARSMAQGA